MSFGIKVNGETVHEVDIDPRLVTGARLHTSAGEAGVGATPFSGVGSNWINVTLDVQQPTVLPVLEDDARLAFEESAADKEIQAYNEVAQRTEAIAEVEQEYADKSAESDEDLSVEKGQAVEDVMDPENRNQSTATSQEDNVTDLDLNVDDQDSSSVENVENAQNVENAPAAKTPRSRK